MNADSRQIAATAAFWRALGVGAALGFAGIGVGAALFGYSYVTDSTASADRIAAAISKSLRDTTFKATGEIALKTDGASVRMEDGKVVLANTATIGLDPSATVKLDPSAKVKVDVGGGDAPRPSLPQLQPPKADSGPAISTNFTIFKAVQLGDGDVVTGWEFASSDQPTPSHQFCYFKKRTTTDGARLVFDVAVDAVLTKLPPPPSLGNFDLNLAAQKCVWFDGSSTRASL